MTLNDLHNPRKIECLYHLSKQHYIEKSENQGWQEYPGSVELWAVIPDGRLVRVRRWLKRSVSIYTEADRVTP